MGRTLRENMENTFEKVAAEPTGPRVTIENIEQAIDGEYYFRPASAFAEVKHEALTKLTFCTFILKNGHAITGEHMFEASEVFSEEMGRYLARENAVKKTFLYLEFCL